MEITNKETLKRLVTQNVAKLSVFFSQMAEKSGLQEQLNRLGLKDRKHIFGAFVAILFVLRIVRSRLRGSKKTQVEPNSGETEPVVVKGAVRTFDPSVTLEQVRDIGEKFADERDWAQYHVPRSLLLAMVGEVGELCECFQFKQEPVKVGLPDFTEEERVHVGEEMADVLIYLTRLADRCGIDLAAATLDKFQKNAKKYPVQKAKGSSKKYSELS